jgi:small-conductance mechanosensitive channel
MSRITLIEALNERNITGEFYNSLREQYDKTKTLSKKQRDLLRQTINRYDEFHTLFEIDPQTNSEFIKSVREQYIRNGKLSEKQIKSLSCPPDTSDEDYYL